MTHAWQSDILNWPKSYAVAILFQNIFYITNAISRRFGANTHRSRDPVSGDDLIYGGRNFGEIEIRRTSSLSRKGQIHVRTLGIDNAIGLKKSWTFEGLSDRFANATTTGTHFKCVPQYYDHDFTRTDNLGDVNEDAIWRYDVGKVPTREISARRVFYFGVALFVLVALVCPVCFVRLAYRAFFRASEGAWKSREKKRA